MPKAKLPPKIVRYFAQDEKTYKRLIGLGISEPKIYRGWKGEVPGKFRMRAGEFLGVLDGLRAFGPGKRAIQEAVAVVHKSGATIIDIETGQDTRTHGIAMANDAIRNRMSPEAKRLLAEERSDKYRKRNHMMLKRDAFEVWKNPKLSVVEKEEITRWSRSALYAAFGKTGAPAGRRPKRNDE